MKSEVKKIKAKWGFFACQRSLVPVAMSLFDRFQSKIGANGAIKCFYKAQCS